MGTDEKRLENTPAPEFFPERFERVPDEAPVHEVAEEAVKRGGARQKPTTESARPKAHVSPEVQDRFARDVGRERSARFAQRLSNAADAFARERYGDAQRTLQILAKQAPNVGEVRELYGLTLYRQGRWREALVELEAFEMIEQTTEQHPVIMDCLRALKRYDDLEERWAELRQESPSADVMAEGRIVMAGSLADRGRLADAIRAMEASVRTVKRPQVHHLRLWYVLADLYDRAGDSSRARSWFRRIVDVEPAFADVADRLSDLT